MADNVGYTPGAGATVAADEVDGALHQRVKISIGDDGSAADLGPSNPMPIVAMAPIEVVAPDGGAIPVSDESLAFLLARMLNVLNAPQGYDKSLQRQRSTAIVESGIITTLTTLSNLAAIDGYTGKIQIVGQNLAAWHQCVRSRIS